MADAVATEAGADDRYRVYDATTAFDRASAAHHGGDDTAARAWLDRCLEIDPTHHPAWFSRASLSAVARDYPTATVDVVEALRWLPADVAPRLRAEYLGHHAVFLQYQTGTTADGENGVTRLSAAADAAEQAVEADPTCAVAWRGLAMVRRRQDRLADSLTAYRRALLIEPHDADAHFHCALQLLALGRWEEGWREYEWRHGIRRDGAMLLLPRQWPMWRGQPVGTLLVVFEQGLGDAIMFLRYLPLLRRRCGRLIFVGLAPLLRLLAQSTVGADVDVIARAGDVLYEPVDAYVNLLSAPYVLNQPVPYAPPRPYLVARADDVVDWARATGQLEPYAPGAHRRMAGPRWETEVRVGQDGALHVGLCWAGDPGHHEDALRTIPLDGFAPLARVPGVKFHNLQVGARALPVEEGVAGGLTPPVADVADTAALMCNLDLVISVDTAVLHLAAALGRPTWGLLSTAYDWRWAQSAGEESSPWYPSLRLFRQRRLGHWGEVVDRVAVALREVVGCQDESGMIGCT